MNVSETIGVLVALGTVISMFFAVPIVMPVVPLLGVLLIVFATLWGAGTIGAILSAYKK